MSVVALFGPTASGKTAVAQAIAERIPAELVSADSMQVYRGLPVLTNQAPARLVAIWPLDHEASVGQYQRLAHEAIDEILRAGRTPLVVGGTGLYLRAALAELELPPAPAPGVRARWERLYDEEGAAAAHDMLAERDPGAAAAVHPNDRRRVVRALELTEAGSSLRPERDRLWAEQTRVPSLVFGLDVPKDVLQKRIVARTRAMFDQGVEAEVAAALQHELSSTSAKVMGLREIGELPRDEALAALVLRTRRYAAYQRKWMRRVPGIIMIPADRSPAEVADAVLEVARARQLVPARRAG